MDCTLEWLKANDVPLTRQNYLILAYMGDSRADGHEIDAELESTLAPEIEKTPTTLESRERVKSAR